MGAGRGRRGRRGLTGSRPPRGRAGRRPARPGRPRPTPGTRRRRARRTRRTQITLPFARTRAFCVSACVRAYLVSRSFSACISARVACPRARIHTSVRTPSVHPPSRCVPARLRAPRSSGPRAAVLGARSAILRRVEPRGDGRAAGCPRGRRGGQGRLVDVATTAVSNPARPVTRVRQDSGVARMELAAVAQKLRRPNAVPWGLKLRTHQMTT